MENSAQYEKIGYIHQLLRRVYHNSRNKENNPTQAQQRIIAALKLQDGISAKDLAFILGIRVPTLNEHLSKLENNGYISREKDPQDGRIILIKLTEIGKSYEETTEDEIEIFAGFSAEEKNRFDQDLDRIIENLEKSQEKFGENNPYSEEWERRARDRMGDEQFERWLNKAEMMGMRGGFSRQGRSRRGGNRGGRGFHNSPFADIYEQNPSESDSTNGRQFHRFNRFRLDFGDFHSER